MEMKMSRSQPLKGKNVWIEGFKITGRAFAQFLIKNGASVFAHDVKNVPEIAEGAQTFACEPRFKFEFGSPTLRIPDGFDMVVASPGVNPDADWVRDCRDRGIEVIGDVELLCRYKDSRSVLIGITGSNGKSTTTAGLGHVLKTAGKDVFVGGNLGEGALLALLRDKPYDFIVLELSSFQIDYTPSLRLNAAALLNVTPDHLDRYKTFENYAASKARVFSNMGADDLAVVNGDCPHSLKSAAGLACSVRYFSQKTKFPRGAFGSPGLIEYSDDGVEERYNTSQCRIVGYANQQNLMTMIIIARRLGLSKEAVEKGIRSFAGLSHRLEFVGESRRVKYYNDSKATNPDSTVVALNSFEEPIILLAGGYDKGLPFDSIAPHAAKKVKLAVLFGATSKKIAEALEGSCPVVIVEDMEAALAKARETAEPGDVVALSPACASFDQFKNFESRGDAFREMVKKIIERE